jgi:hypothetical protein
MTVKEWRDILLAYEDSIVYNGNVVQLKARDLGYGVVEVYKDLYKQWVTEGSGTFKGSFNCVK